MVVTNKLHHLVLLLFSLFVIHVTSFAQQNLLVNGDFEDINNCAEYHAECGVEGWFYMSSVQVQLGPYERPVSFLGHNTLTLFYSWFNNARFNPVIGTLLPCSLQKGQTYTFKGCFTARLNGKLTLAMGVATGEYFYVPGRPFVEGMVPDSISNIEQIPNTDFYAFTYSFIATGKEKYLTLGTFIKEDELASKGFMKTKEMISLTLDHFELLSANKNETVCTNYAMHKNIIYQYDFRHKNMDYTLYGKGELPILNDKQNEPDSNNITRIVVPPIQPASDTILLGDVLFDFNQSKLKPAAISLLQKVFKTSAAKIDSIYIEGHTDAIGSEEKNLLLSKQRSQAVKEWLLQQTIVTEDKIAIHPFGKSRPVATNNTPAGRSLNRRVELIIFRSAN